MGSYYISNLLYIATFNNNSVKGKVLTIDNCLTLQGSLHLKANMD